MNVLAWNERARAVEGEGDVLLLDAGIAVPDGTLERLRACAAREASVATVSPWGDGGRFAVYRAEADAETIARLASESNAADAVDLPAAEERCVYVTRRALHAAGSPEDFAEFSRRCTAFGLRHLLAADAFVARGGDAAPDDRETLRAPRRRIDLARLAASPRPRWLMVSHGLGGGVERHVRDVARLLEDDCEVLRLCADEGALRMEWLRTGEALQAWFPATQWDALVALLRGIGIDRVHVHHVDGLPKAVLGLAAALDVPYDATLHDYFPACPRYHLEPPEGGTCAHEAPRCERCLGDGAHPWGLDVPAWRRTFEAWLRGAARVIVPSRDAQARLATWFPAVRFEAWTHPEEPRRLPAVFKVALVGGISRIKGAGRLRDCVDDAVARGLPLHFHVCGAVDRTLETFPARPLTIGGSYEEDSLPRLLALERPDAFLFLSQVPETYSYTLSAALETGRPIVATAAGAFPERLEGRAQATLVPVDAPAARINDALLASLR